MIGLITQNPKFYFGENYSKVLNNIAISVGVEGLYDLPQYSVDWPDFKPDIAITFGPDSKHWDSPVHYKIENKINWLIIHSKDDQWIDEKQPNTMYNHLKSQQTTETKIIEKILIKRSHFEVIEEMCSSNDQITVPVLDLIQRVAKQQSK